MKQFANIQNLCEKRDSQLSTTLNQFSRMTHIGFLLLKQNLITFHLILWRISPHVCRWTWMHQTKWSFSLLQGKKTPTIWSAVLKLFSNLLLKWSCEVTSRWTDQRYKKVSYFSRVSNPKLLIFVGWSHTRFHSYETHTRCCKHCVPLLKRSRKWG